MGAKERSSTAEDAHWGTDLCEQVREPIDGDGRTAESLGELRDLVHEAPLQIARVDRDRRLTYVNRVAGGDLGAVLGTPLLRWVDAPFRPAVAAALDRIFERGTRELIELHARGPGRSRWLCCEAGPVRRDGRVVEAVIFAIDISAQKAAQERAERLASLLSTAERISRMGSWEWEPAAGTLVWSPGLYAMLGVDPRDLEPTYEAYLSFVADEDRARVDAVVRSALERRSDFHVAARLVRADGEERIVESAGETVDEAHGRVVMVGTCVDVTEEVRAEHAVRKDEARFRSLFEDAGNGIALAGPDGTMRVANRALAELLGCEREALVGARLLDLVDPRDRDRSVELWRSVARGGADRGEIRVLRGDGEAHWVEVIVSPMRSEEEVVQVVVHVLDAEERRRAADALKRANEMLDRRVEARTRELAAANDELESFSYTVSHDLRAPLRAIDGFAAALAGEHADRLDPDGLEYLARIRAAASKTSQLVDDLLALSRVTRSAMGRRPVDLSALAGDVIEDLRETAPSRAVDVRIAPGLVAEGDTLLLRLVLENLLGNAWKFTAKKARARIEVGEAETPRGRAFFVRDDGAGFDPALAARVFAPFQRLHAEGEFEGTGIGLATVRRIVQRHGGEVWADGAPDRGATFWFTLPRPTE